jgi:tRNA threonylcarbamoyladenosine biosynthesis protein TsaB
MRNGYMFFIEASLKEAGLTYKDLSAIAVSQGPGSYTGLSGNGG